MLNKFLFLILLLVLAFILQTARFISVGAVEVNLVLIGFLLIIFLPQAGKKINLWLFVILLATPLAFGFFWFRFWVLPIIILDLLILLIYLLKNFLTGNKLIDFLLSLLFGTLFFYFLINIRGLNQLDWFTVFRETLYNVLLGTSLWFLLTYWKIHEQFRS